MFVTACDGVVPTTTCGKVVPTTATEDVRPREPGRYRTKVMSLGDRQGGSKCQLGVGTMIKKIGERGLQGLNHQLSTKKKDPFNTGLFFCPKLSVV